MGRAGVDVLEDERKMRIPRESSTNLRLGAQGEDRSESA